MNDCKMYNMPINVEGKHKNKNSKKGLHLSLVHWKKKTEWASRKIRLIIFKSILAIIPAWIVSLWAIPEAYAHRGYKAVGGEWILIIVVFGFSFNLISNHIDRKIRKEKRKRRLMKYYHQGN